MKYLITGGGTGGHIYPALAIANKIRDMDKEAEILYVGIDNSMESSLVPRAGFEFKAIRVRPLPRKINKKFLGAIFESFKGLGDSFRIIKKFRPDVVVGTGGYVSGPLVMSAALKGVPSLIHEQNAYPGITNKILSLFVDRVAITFEDARDRFPRKKNIVLTGNPIRDSIFKVDKKSAYEVLGLKENKKTILSFGGSGGQKSLNDAVASIINRLPKNVQLLHITGDRLYDDFKKSVNMDSLAEGVKVLSYLHKMPEALNIADLVITPSGAITLSEISALGLPSILIPKSYTAENHQVYNGKFFLEMGAAKMILEKDLTGDLLLDTIENLLFDDKILEQMSINSRKLSNLNALEDIYKLINSLSYKNY